jgi:hypothetical protein
VLVVYHGEGETSTISEQDRLLLAGAEDRDLLYFVFSAFVD